MNGDALRALLPILVLGATAIAGLVSIAIRRRHATTAAVVFAGLALTCLAVIPARASAPRFVTALLRVDAFALYFTALVAAATLACGLVGYDYWERRGGHAEEFYVLLALGALGAAVLASSVHFASLFLGLETLSVALYGLIAYARAERAPLEAGLKYLVLAGVSSAFLLFGMALLYAELGTLTFAGVGEAVMRGGTPALLPVATVLMLAGVGFKLAVVPFHLWTPDVYQGAPAPSTMFIATVSKAAMFALLLRGFLLMRVLDSRALVAAFSAIAVLSMLGGNLLALRQENLKRLLAYSSIAHLGYLLVAFIVRGPWGAAAGAFYATAYVVTTLGAFAVVTLLSTAERDANRLDDYRGLARRRPIVAGVFTAMLLSLAGIPLTAGFFGKFYVVAAATSAADWALAIVLVVASAIGLFYYLRVTVVLYAAETEPASAPVRTARTPAVVLSVLAVLLFWLGVWPGPVLDVIRTAVARLS